VAQCGKCDSRQDVDVSSRRASLPDCVQVICHNDFAPYNLAHRIVPLSTADWGDTFREDERRHRLARLLTAYGSGVRVRGIADVIRRRLGDLARLSDDLAQRLNKPDLHHHATLYRYDAAQLPEM
jgi:hypothetical protein